MGETFESEHEDEFEDVEDDERPPFRPPNRRKKVDDVPDAPVENAADIPLLSYAGTSKSNTVTYLKVTRLDGPRGVRGLKGKLPPESTYEDVARRYGNGTYKIEGCSQRHKVLAREEGLEIAIPGFDEDEGKPAAPAPVGFNPNFALHQMKLVTDMATEHGRSIKEQSASGSEQVREMANKTMEMMTAFTAAQRESERNAYSQAAANQQSFFATMLATMQTAHAQQMEMLTAMNERARKSEIDPMAMVQMFVDGLKTGGELGGGGDVEPWLAALKEGTTSLGHLATLARTGGNAETPALPPRPRALPTTTVERKPREEGKRRKKRLPFKREEIKGVVQLRAELRKRGIPFEAFLEQTAEHYRSVPDSDLYEGDDGPVESEDHAAEQESSGDQA